LHQPGEPVKGLIDTNSSIDSSISSGMSLDRTEDDLVKSGPSDMRNYHPNRLYRKTSPAPAETGQLLLEESKATYVTATQLSATLDNVNYSCE
jgi:hypothetical protein